MNPEMEFDWDEANVGHVARHGVLPEEAEQVVLNDPVDLGRAVSQPRRDAQRPRPPRRHRVAREPPAGCHGV